MTQQRREKVLYLEQRVALTSDQVGDVNLDGIINILDVVATVNMITDGEGNLDQYPENSRADFNQDGTVNVLDVVGMVNFIIGA